MNSEVAIEFKAFLGSGSHKAIFNEDAWSTQKSYCLGSLSPFLDLITSSSCHLQKIEKWEANKVWDNATKSQEIKQQNIALSKHCLWKALNAAGKSARFWQFLIFWVSRSTLADISVNHTKGYKNSHLPSCVREVHGFRELPLLLQYCGRKGDPSAVVIWTRHACQHYKVYQGIGATQQQGETTGAPRAVGLFVLLMIEITASESDSAAIWSSNATILIRRVNLSKC